MFLLKLPYCIGESSKYFIWCWLFAAGWYVGWAS